MFQPVISKRLMIYLSERTMWRGRPLYLNILETLLKGDIRTAVAIPAMAGFGTDSQTQRTINIKSGEVPVVITVVDTPENIDKAISLIEPMVYEEIMTVEEIGLIKSSRRYLQPLPAERPASEVMTREVTTVALDTPAYQVVELLLGKFFKAVPVVDAERHVVGIISDGDLLHKAGMPAHLGVGQRLQADDLREFITRVSHEKTAKEIMTSPVITAFAADSLGSVVQRMVQHNLKRMPVVDSWNKLVGMISRLDILRVIAGNTEQGPDRGAKPQPGQTIGDVMSRTVPTVYAHDDLTHILQKMLKSDMRRVIVLDEKDHPVGIITDGDVVARVQPGIRRNVLQAFTRRMLGTGLMHGMVTAQDLMSSEVLTAPPAVPIVDAIALVLRERRKQVVVVDAQNHPIGMVDRQTLLAASLGSVATEPDRVE